MKRYLALLLPIGLQANIIGHLFDFHLEHEAIEHNAPRQLKKEIKQEKRREIEKKQKRPAQKAEHLEYDLASYDWRSLDLEKPIFDGCLRVVLIGRDDKPRLARARMQGGCLFVDDERPQETQYWAYDEGDAIP